MAVDYDYNYDYSNILHSTFYTYTLPKNAETGHYLFLNLPKMGLSGKS